MFSPPHVILLQPAKFCSNPTTGVGVMTSYRFFQDGGHKIGNLLRCLGFVLAVV